MKAIIYKNGSVYVDKGFGYIQQQCFKRAGTSLAIPTKTTTTTTSGGEKNSSYYYRTGLFKSRTDTYNNRQDTSVSYTESKIETIDSPNCSPTCPAFMVDGNNINLCCGTLKCTHIYFESRENISIEDFRKFFIENQDRFLKALAAYNPEKRQKSYPRILLSDSRRPCRIDEVHDRLWFDYRYDNVKSLIDDRVNCYSSAGMQDYMKEIAEKHRDQYIEQYMKDTEEDFIKYERGANPGPYFKLKRDMDNLIYERTYWARIEEIFESCKPLEFMNWSEFIDSLKEPPREQM